MTSIDSKGSIYTAGSISIGGVLDVGTLASLASGLSLKKTQILAGKEISIPFDTAFVEVIDDGASDSNILHLPTRKDGLKEGQVLIILNSDADDTKSPTIRSGSTIMFIFNGHTWMDIQALKVPTQNLTGNL